MKTHLALSLCLIYLTSCHVNFESSRVEYYSPNNRHKANLKGNVTKVEETNYHNFSRAKIEQITEDGKILALDNNFTKRIRIFSDKGICLSSTRYLLGNLESMTEYDDQGKKIFHKYEGVDGYVVERFVYKMLSENLELVEISENSVNSDGDELEMNDSYTVEYDKKGLPLVKRDKNGRVIDEWIIGKGRDHTEKHYFYDDYSIVSGYNVYDKGVLKAYHNVKDGSARTYNTEYTGEIKTITEVFEINNTKEIESIKEYKNNKLTKKVYPSTSTTYYNENEDEIRIVYTGIEPHSYNYEYVYDSYGNWVVKRQFDAEGICTSITLRRILYYDDSEASDFLNSVVDKYVVQKYVESGTPIPHIPTVNAPVQRFKSCPSCLGGGLCSYCNGSGIYYYAGGQTSCAVCGGNGKCSMCAGRGGEYILEY